MLNGRTPISKLQEVTIQHNLQQLQEASYRHSCFPGPFVLDFLGLADNYSEKDLEGLILAQLQQFIIELGSDSAFLARQKKFSPDGSLHSVDHFSNERRQHV
ncbi:PDDEXK nuclease domain-containing protein [Sabulibacter ruber]|uniref:PDDEXK nuclease domain-containing protein n=1 Tax=Sabulibacter ruber TaxID=2811901 RepID=UPI001A977213|nr:PDDEXK nuclease domain-containing protein [Sabulibacter ruber]